MRIKPQHHHAAVRFGGLAFCLILLWAVFHPMGYAWSMAAGIVFDALLLVVTGALTLIQAWRYQRDIQDNGRE